jgi:spore maturation protein CgeB
VKIGFYLKWDIDHMYQNGWIIGEAYYFRSVCNELSKLPGVEFARQYDLVTRPDTQLDVMIYVNDTEPIPSLAKKNVLYLQNGFGEGMDTILERLRPLGYDGYIFISKKLLSLHESQGYHGIYLPFGADLTKFCPKEADASYNYDVVFVGNDIKGHGRTMRYLSPMFNYNFGLFGMWGDGDSFCQKIFSRICKGRLDYDKVPLLYSNAKISLNFTFPDQVNWGAMTDRPFQIMACKGFLISDYVPGFEDELRGCMIVTNGGLDIINKIDYYLSRTKERQEIADNGYQYVIKHASIQSRVGKLYNYLREIL